MLLGNTPIALVDDDPSVRSALERLLLAMGFRVSAFCSAEEFLTRKDSGDFACLILDVHLLGMSGLDLSAQLAETGSKLPIIFMSAAADAPGAVSARTDGKGLLLVKPLDADVLDAALTKTLQSTLAELNSSEVSGGAQPARKAPKIPPAVLDEANAIWINSGTSVPHGFPD
jgi:FixJ family two-component response regulator